MKARDVAAGRSALAHEIQMARPRVLDWIERCNWVLAFVFLAMMVFWISVSLIS